MPEKPLTVLCVASYKKGEEFLRQCRREGCRVVLLTSKSLEHEDWPRESIDTIHYIPDVDKEWNMHDVIHGVSYMARGEQIDRIVALDDFDVEKAAALREHLRLPGMGDTTARYFRDKLAMRTRALDAEIPVPRFVHVLNYDRMREFMAKVPPPYVLKPRLQAGSLGIKKTTTDEEVWRTLDVLGDKQSFYVLEEFLEGDIFHVDSIVFDNEVLFAISSKYSVPPLEVSQQGRVFATRTLPRGSFEDEALRDLNKRVLRAMGLKQGVSHTEFLQQKGTGRFHFIETSARVGGAHIVELVEAASGLNLWAEWAKIETKRDGEVYRVKEERRDHAALMISLARQQWPDLAAFNDPEVAWRLHKEHHAGVIVRSANYDRVTQLLESYTQRFYDEFFASAPPKEKASG
jgi:biotin carboxylase